MDLDELTEQVGKLEREGTLKSLDQARKLLMEHCSRFGPEHQERLLDNAARIHTEIMEMVEETYGVSFKNMDLGDTPHIEI